jgi:hypothetical protein
VPKRGKHAPHAQANLWLPPLLHLPVLLLLDFLFFWFSVIFFYFSAVCGLLSSWLPGMFGKEQNRVVGC